MDSTDISPLVLVYGCLIIYEIADKGVDVRIADEYKDGSLSSNPKESVYKALNIFTAFGILLTVSRITVYVWRIELYRTGNTSQDKLHDRLNLWMSVAKALFEAFPQSTIAQFCFSNCVTENNVKALVQVFDAFSIFPFIMFVFFLLYYYCRHYEELDRVTVIIMVTTFIFSVLGFIFACSSIDDFNEQCPARPFR